MAGRSKEQVADLVRDGSAKDDRARVLRDIRRTV
jgi:hypothetical protein